MRTFSSIRYKSCKSKKLSLTGFVNVEYLESEINKKLMNRKFLENTSFQIGDHFTIDF